MKRLLIPGLLSLFVIAACDTSKLAVTSADDVYAVPSEELAKAKARAEEEAKARALAREQERAQYGSNYSVTDAPDTAGSNNPYYREPEYSSDDYYDYAYAARINRFYNPIGVGYYDSYYTNVYTYNPNPLFYGTSIYSSYNFGMPSSYFGIGFGYGFGNGWYSTPYYSWGYPYYSYGLGYYNNFGYYDPFFGGYSYFPGYYYNNSYWNGYYNGYNRGYWNGYYNNGWTYFNQFDNNSGYQHLSNGPREVHSGGMRNSSGQPRAGLTESQAYYQQVADQQSRSDRFVTRSNQRVRATTADQTSGSGARVNSAGNGGRGATYNSQGSSTRSSETRGSSSRNQGRVYNDNRQQGTQMERSSGQKNSSSGQQSNWGSNNNSNSGTRSSGGSSSRGSSGSSGGSSSPRGGSSGGGRTR